MGEVGLGGRLILMFRFTLMLTLLINRLLPEVAFDFGDKY